MRELSKYPQMKVVVKEPNLKPERITRSMPYKELMKDLSDILQSITICTTAINHGILQYGEDEASVLDRLITEIKVQMIIAQELKLRLQEVCHVCDGRGSIQQNLGILEMGIDPAHVEEYNCPRCNGVLTQKPTPPTGVGTP